MNDDPSRHGVIDAERNRVLEAREELLKLVGTSPARLGPEWKWNREELYDRANPCRVGKGAGHTHGRTTRPA
jgi:hypothetical protein